MHRECRIGILGQERPPVGGVTRLQQHRMALRRARQGGDTAHVELGPAVFDDTNAAGVDVDSVLAIGDDGVGCPAVPELAGDGDELLGPLVAIGVVEEPAAAEVLAGERVRRGDHVPAGTAIGQVVEGGELSCHFEWFVEGRVDGPGQAETVGDRGKCGEHGERVGPADHVEVVDASAVFAQPQAFGEEEEVEQAPLGGLGQVDERVELDLAARLGIRPHRGVVDAGEMCGQWIGLRSLPSLDRSAPTSSRAVRG